VATVARSRSPEVTVACSGILAELIADRYLVIEQGRAVVEGRHGESTCRRVRGPD
jgi:hypothetical protein